MTTPNTQSVTLREALEKTLEAIKETAKWDGPTDWSYMISYIESALSQPPAPEQASGERGITKINPGFRWDANALHHVPQLLIEFTPVPANSPSDAKGWVERDALANLLAATTTVEPAGEAAAVTDEMVTAYLAANKNYWHEVDQLPRTPTKKWRQGTPEEATRISLIAALSASPAAPEAAKPDTLREIGLTRDTSGMCVVTVNGREVIRDNGDFISHFATLNWFASFSAPVDKVANELLNCADDYRYLLTITENKNNLHGWLRMRLANISLATSVAAKPEQQAQAEPGEKA